MYWRMTSNEDLFLRCCEADHVLNPRQSNVFHFGTSEKIWNENTKFQTRKDYEALMFLFFPTCKHAL